MFIHVHALHSATLWTHSFGRGSLGLERGEEEMVKTRTENVLREEEYGKEEEKGRRARNIRRLKVPAEDLQWWEKFLKEQQ